MGLAGRASPRSERVPVRRHVVAVVGAAALLTWAAQARSGRQMGLAGCPASLVAVCPWWPAVCWPFWPVLRSCGCEGVYLFTRPPSCSGVPLGVAGTMALQMAAMVATRSLRGGPSWLGAEPPPSCHRCQRTLFLLYWCSPWFCRWRPWVRSPLRCEASRGGGGGSCSLPVARPLRPVLVEALWCVRRGFSSLVLSASPPFGYIGPRWGWGYPRWCYAFRLRR